MDCKQCGATIERGKRYKSETHKSIPFCCESCYNAYVQGQLSNPMLKLNEEIHNLWMEEPNYGIIGTQAKQITNKYNISINDIRLIVRYAILYCDEKPKYDMPMLGLYQFIPKYMNEALEFANTIRTNKRLAEDWTDITYYNKIKPTKRKQHIGNKNCEW